jgi:hypothetical protein
VPCVVIVTFFVFYGGFLRCHEKDKTCSPLASAALNEGVSDSDEVKAASYSARAS